MNRVFCPTAIALLPLLLAIGCGTPSEDVPTSTTEPAIEAPQDNVTSEAAAEDTASAPAHEDPAAQPEPTSAEPTPASESASESAAPVASDNLVIPGEQVGPIQRDTDRQSLATIFGEDQLTDEDIPVGEGFLEPGTQVDLGNGRSLTVIWTDDTRSRPLEIRNLDDQWQTPEGIHIGQSVSDLKGAIGEFQFYGFAWDYGGTVLMESSELDQYQGLLFLRLRPTNEESLYNGENAIVGDALYPSDHPDLESLDAIVNDMIIVLNPSTWN